MSTTPDHSRDPTWWYDRIAPLYDLSVAGIYGQARRTSVRQLRLEPGQCVLDVACGTGENFSHLVEAIGPSGTVIGADYSDGMLARARRKVERNGWTNVHLVHADAATLSPTELGAALGSPDVTVQRVVCTLGYSVIPDWQAAFERTWKILEPGGRYAIMDWYRPRRTLFTRLIDTIAASEIGRRSWELLERRASEFERENLLLGQIFVASGSKP